MVAEETPVTKISDLLKQAKPVMKVKVGVSILDVVGKMAAQKASTVFVHDAQGVVQGVIKEKDIVKHAAENAGNLLGSAEEIMDKNVSYAHPETSVREALKLLNESKQDHLPILDSFDSSIQQDDLTKIISAKLIIGSAYSEAIGETLEHLQGLNEQDRIRLEDDVQKMLKLPTVKQIVRVKREKSEAKGPLGTMVLNTLIEDEVSVLDVVRQMTKLHKGSVAVLEPVRDTSRLVGIATEQDIIRRCFAKSLDPETTLISEIITKDELATVTTKDTLLACAFKMIDRNVRHLPIVNASGERIISMVSSKDVVDYMCSNT